MTMRNLDKKATIMSEESKPKTNKAIMTKEKGKQQWTLRTTIRNNKAIMTKKRPLEGNNNEDQKPWPRDQQGDNY